MKKRNIYIKENYQITNKHDTMDPPAVPVPIPVVDLKYRHGKIYYLYSLSHPDAGVYIGSSVRTTKRRFTLHKTAYKRYLAGKSGYCSSFKILEFGDAVIVKLEDFPCNNENELKLREQAIINFNRARCVNLYNPAPTAEERKSKDRSTKQTYRQAHAQEIKAKHHAYKQIYVICECGERVNKASKARHMRTQKHITAMENLNP